MSLVPYSKAFNKGLQLAKYTPAGKNVALAARTARAAKTVYDTGIPQMAARKIGRSYRSFRARKNRQRERVGKAPSEVPSSKIHTALDADPTARDSRTLYQTDVTTIVAAGSFNDIDNRQRDQVYMSGVKIAISLENTSQKPVHWNVAMVMNRRNPQDAIATDDFFKGSGSGRGLNFSNLLNSNDFRARAINTDANVVLMHKRFTLSPSNSTAYEEGWKPSFLCFDDYVPIKRIITYDNGGDANNRIHLVFWCDEFNTAGGILPSTNVITQSTRLLTFFKEPKINY